MLSSQFCDPALPGKSMHWFASGIGPKTASIFLLVLSCLLLAYGFSVLHSSGWTGATLKQGGSGCTCHGLTPSDSVTIRITGPDSVRFDQTVTYTLTMTGGPAVKGGCDIASSSGTLTPVDSALQAVSGELTHTFPKPFMNDSVSWQFSYLAPGSGAADTIFSVGNSVNGNGNPQGDAYNFGSNFIVHLVLTAGVEEQPEPESFSLSQNYPNPFNPLTNIEFTTRSRGAVTLRVFDLDGREVSVLISGTVESGRHVISFNGANLASGLYVYRLEAGRMAKTMKMVLVK